MARDSDKRNFALREDGDESSVFSGGTPRQAALKAARRLDPADSEDEADRQEIRLREKGTHKVHLRGVGLGRNSARRQTGLDAGRHHEGERLERGRRTPRRHLVLPVRTFCGRCDCSLCPSVATARERGHTQGANRLRTSRSKTVSHPPCLCLPYESHCPV